MRIFQLLTLSFLPLALAACTHVKGTVMDTQNHPLTTAKFSIGRPDGVGAFATYPVNDRGDFDFYISPTDENALYVYDSTGNPSLTMRRIDRSDISEKMKIHMHPASADMMPGMNIMQ
jgi:hypothetical protein